MTTTRRAQITSAILLCLVVVPLFRLACALIGLLPAPMPEVLSPPPRSRTPYETAWQTARWHWMLCQEAACRQLERLEPWDPAMAEPINVEIWRRQFLARDTSGYLRRARKAAVQAQVLARTPHQAYRATLMRLRIERDAGHPPAELRQAHRLVALAPEDQNARWLLQAALMRIGRDRWAWGGARSAPALRGPSEAALREARHFWRRAVLAVKPEIEAWAAEHPDVITETEAWRRMMARDQRGDLRRACVAAQLAAARARTPEQTYQAEMWLALIECNRRPPSGGDPARAAARGASAPQSELVGSADAGRAVQRRCGTGTTGGGQIASE
jgi:hypothetical protein